MDKPAGGTMLPEYLQHRPFLIAGPCALETEALVLHIAGALKNLSQGLNLPVIFKGSYTKANRTHEDAFHGVGLEQGLELLAMVKEATGLPVTSDVHEVCEVERAAQVLDVIQIPALLCKNTALLHAVGDTGKPVNIKKGHFVTAGDLRHSLEKIESRGNHNILVTERGTLFGYGDTIVDFRSLRILKSFGYPVIFDATHSVRITSRRSVDPAGGSPEDIPLLSRCAAAAGVAGLFIETHPRPKEARCDAVVSYPTAELPKLVRDFLTIHRAATGLDQ
jgi:2-dehydro-3-deoxyphosphooctonate aldolase (KDO 8-P synthase)